MGEGVEGWMDMYKTGGMDRQPSWGGGQAWWGGGIRQCPPLTVPAPAPKPGTAGQPLVPSPLGLALTVIILVPGEEQVPLQLVDEDGSGLGGDTVVREDVVVGEGGPGPPQGHSCGQAQD